MLLLFTLPLAVLLSLPLISSGSFFYDTCSADFHVAHDDDEEEVYSLDFPLFDQHDLKLSLEEARRHGRYFK